MLNQLYFNGKALSDFGVEVKGDAVYNAPARDVESISIPGRNGYLLIDNGRYSNIKVDYPAYILRTFRDPSFFDAFRAFMLANTGYHRIEDTYHPEEYRIGRLASEISPNVYERGYAGEFSITFDCKPQRFLKDGEQTITFEQAGSIQNFTLFDAKPLLRVYGFGTFGIGSDTVTIISADEYTDIDCELMDAFKGATNCNGNIVLNSGRFPVLTPGANGVSLGSGITKIEITPRWYTL